MTQHDVVIAGGGPTGLMLAGELALAGVDVVVVERRTDQRVDGWKLAQVVRGTSPGALLDTYHRERHPVGARVLHNTMAQVAIGRQDERHQALRETLGELLAFDEPRRMIAGMISGLDVRYDLGGVHPLVGRRIPDLDLQCSGGPLRMFALLHDAHGVLVNFGEPGVFGLDGWSDRVRTVDARYDGAWDLPVIGEVDAPPAVLIRPDGHVAWVGEPGAGDLTEAVTTWFGPPTGPGQPVPAAADARGPRKLST